MARAMTEAAVCDVLRAVPLFADMPDEGWAVASRAHTFWQPKGARVFEEGGPANACLMLTSGRAKVVLNGARDSEIILGMVQPYAVIGEIALLDNSTRSAGLVTVEKSHFIGITARHFSNCERTGHSRIGSCAMSPRCCDGPPSGYEPSTPTAPRSVWHGAWPHWRPSAASASGAKLQSRRDPRTTSSRK